MKRIFCLMVAALLLGGGFGRANASDIPTILKSKDFKKLGLSSFAFLKVSQSARVAGMGDAFTAIADDINAMYYNPAGLAHIRGVAYNLSYVNWLLDTAFYSGAIAYNTPKGIFGISVMNYDAGAMEVRTILKPEGTGEQIKSGAIAIGFAYAARVTDRLGLGLRATYVQETLHEDQMTSVVFDVGTHFYTGFRSARVAMSLRNFGPDTKVLSTEQKFLMPVNFDIGGAMEIYGEKGDPVSLTVSFQSEFAVDYAQRWHMGGELWLANTVALRGGYKFNYDAEDYSMGLGVKTKVNGRTITADFAYSDFGPLFDAPFRLSIGGEF